MSVKRLLTMLLAICMVVSLLAPAVSAVAPAPDSITAAKAEAATKVSDSPFANDRVVASDDAAGSSNLRDDPIIKPNVETSTNGSWSASPVEGLDASLTISETPECIAELKEAAEIYKASDVVTAFVVMEEKPLAETFSSIKNVSASDEKKLLKKQDAVISKIEKNVLDGVELEVRYQFTYLTNSFSISTEFGNLSEIAMMDGVKSVYLMPVYNPCVTEPGTANPNTASSGNMTGVAQVWQDLGYYGEGMKIAVIDTGLDLDHPSFAAEPTLTADSLTMDDIDDVLTDLNAYAKRNTITSKTLYRSGKVPFAFNYVDNSLTADHSADNQGDHGTHVAGIAAANKLEGTSVVGMAPEAQLIILKVFGAAGGAYTDDIVAALEDAMTLGCDVVNLSLGSAAGFSSSDTEIDLIYARLAEQDIIATISAGNEGTSSDENMWGTDLNRTQNPDNATVGQPGTYVNATTIASAENAVVMTSYLTAADTQIFYTDPYQYYYALGDMAGEELEYYVIDGLGYETDFYGSDGMSLVEGKVAVVRRGELSFGTKIMNAEAAGAIAVLVWNNVSEDIYNFGMQISDDGETYPTIPAGLISLENGEKMAAAENKTLVISAKPGERPSAESGQMSVFSSWGVSPNLSLEPDLTGIGGNVYSCYDGGGYGLMSGTSMSAPQVAGVTALVMQYLQDRYGSEGKGDGTLRTMANALLMSTADPIISADSGIEVSPRQQGAGLVDAFEAITTNAYLTVNGDMPKGQLGDNNNGTYSFTFKIHNVSEESKTYTFDSILMTEAAAGMQLSETEVEYFMYGMNQELSGTVSFDKESVTVAAGSTAEVTVSIALSDADKAYFAECWENGGYVEGYVYLNTTSEEGVVTNELNLPFLGFYGDWTDAPVFDTAYWYDNSFWGAAPATGLPEGDEYYHIMWTSLMGTDWLLGLNPYTGVTADQNGNVIYDPAHNAVSPNGDGVLDSLDEIYLSLLRNVKELTITYTNAETGEVLDKEVINNASKTMYISSYGQIIPWLYSWYGSGMYNFTGADGKYLPNNTKVNLTITAKIDHADGGEHSIQIPITVDTEGPALLQTMDGETEGALRIVAADNVALADVFVTNNTGTQIWGEQPNFTKDDNGNYIVDLDVTGLGTSFTLILCDYAGNESYYQVSYTSAGDNLPAVDTSKLYGYRTYDNYVYSDHMYGWISMNKPASAEAYAQIAVHTDDYMEYAAINAAEFVGGKIFAVDAVYNLVMMTPGLWDRVTLCNLGVNVLDMTFDDSTDTMYVITKQDDYTYLCTLDLLTGKLTELHSYGYYNYGPYALADDDNGTLYAVQYGKANLFTLDENYEMVAITGADGNAIVITDANGTNVNPNYAQSMTYEDGILYWSYYTSSWRGDSSCLICIDVETMTAQTNVYAAMAYDEAGDLVEYYPSTEVLGLHTLTPTGYQIPAAEALESLWLNQTVAVLGIGETTALAANPLPWNYDLTDVQWTSSNEAVATVDQNGVVTAVAEGNAVVTAAHGDVTTSCTITVVDVDGNFYAYNYFSNDGNYGYMIDVDMGTSSYELMNISPVDFIAADYNGHDGYYYGFTEGGQFWRLDLETNEAVKLGEPTGAAPTDMAYDYSTGLMYVSTIDYNMGYSTISAVNLNNGQLMELGRLDYYYLMTLACDIEGNIYALDYSGALFKLYIEDGCIGGEMLMEGLGNLEYMQSMCYDHNNDVLLWTYPEASQVYWIDFKNENPYVISLGDPTNSGLIEFVGMYTIPAEIPALDAVAIDHVTAQDMLLLVGAEKMPYITVSPFNATEQTAVLTSSDESVVKVTEKGTLLGVADGVATISYTITDNIGGSTFEGSFDVQVLKAADDIYGHILTDLATYGGQYWVRLYATNPSDPDVLEATNYVIWAEEYYDGKLYAFGYDPDDWSGNWQMFIMDPVSHAIEEQVEMAEGYPFIYDMTYDYNTSTMYAVAGPSDNASDLYIVDMETGELILLMETEQFFMSLAATDDGLYAMEPSVAEMDEFGGETGVYSNATLYKIDPIAKSLTVVGDTGMKSNMVASMSYDYDTGYLYWTPIFQGTSYVSSLSIIDTETGVASSLGTIGAAGAQVAGLYIISENVPEETNVSLNDLLIQPGKTSVTVGNTVEVKAYALPLSLDAAITWTSSNKAVATVDANGVVTGIANGKAVITATVTYGDVTKTATCEVAVLAADAAFLTYNTTDGGWAAISRADTTQVTNLTVGECCPVAAVTAANGTVYGYDVNNNLFVLNTETFDRTTIGTAQDLAAITEYLTMVGYEGDEIEAQLGYWAFEVRDMAYDAANDRMLVLGNVYDAEYGEMSYGNAIYEVDLTTGELTKLFTFMDLYYVMAMACLDDGSVIAYNAYSDYYTKVDLATGAVTYMVSLQTQSYYGDYESDHTLYFDEVTGMVYHLFTTGAGYYSLIALDPATSSFTVDGEYVGEVIYDDIDWAYYGDLFTGLGFVDVKIPEAPIVRDHSYKVSASADVTCTEDGYITYTCAICGDSYTTITEAATGHNHVVTDSKEATCTQDGYTVYTCENCGDSYTEVIEATGHNFQHGTCTNCGKKQSIFGAWFDWLDKWFGSWWGDCDTPSQPTEPSVPETEPSQPETDPSEPEDGGCKPGFGGWFDWIFGGWWH